MSRDLLRRDSLTRASVRTVGFASVARARRRAIRVTAALDRAVARALVITRRGPLTIGCCAFAESHRATGRAGTDDVAHLAAQLTCGVTVARKHVEGYHRHPATRKRTSEATLSERRPPRIRREGQLAAPALMGDVPQTRSMTAALPSPAPPEIATRAVSRSRRSSSSMTVANRIWPVAPIACPIEMMPPLTLNRSGSMS